MTEDCHLNRQPRHYVICIGLYLGLNPHPLSSWQVLMPTRPQWQCDDNVR